MFPPRPIRIIYTCIIILLFSFYVAGQQTRTANPVVLKYPKQPPFLRNGNYPQAKRMPNTVLQISPDSAAGCITTTFLKHLSQPGQKIILTELQNTGNGDFVCAGNLFATGSNLAQGILYRVDNGGNLLNQKQITINNDPVFLSGIKLLHNGRMVIYGMVQGGGPPRVFISEINNSFTPLWVNVYNVPAQPEKILVDFSGGNKLIMAVQHQGNITFSRLNGNGAFLWTKTISPAGLDQLMCIGDDGYNNEYLLCNVTRTGKKQSELINVKVSDGSFLSAHIHDNGTDEWVAGAARYFSGRIVYSGVTRSSTGVFKLFRNNTYTSSLTPLQHLYTTPQTTGFTTTVAMDNAAELQAYCFPQTGKMVVMRHFTDYLPAPIFSVSIDVPVGAQMAGAARSYLDGGFLVGLNSSDSSEIIFVKTDSTGRLPGCGQQDITVNSEEQYNISNTATGTVVQNAAINMQTGIQTQTTPALSITTVCNQSVCPPAPPDDTCLNTYYKKFRSNSEADFYLSAHLMRNNRQIVVSGRHDRIWDNEYTLRASIKLLDERGGYIKGSLLSLNDTVINNVISRRIDDAHILLIIITTDNGLPVYTFTKINDDLQVIWTKSIKFNTGFSTNFGLPFGDLVKDDEGNFYLLGYDDGFIGTEKILAYKMDANGNPLWLSVYEFSMNGYFYSCSGTTNATSLLVMVEGNPNVSLQLNKSNGQLTGTNSFSISANGGAVYTRLYQKVGDRVLYVGNIFDEMLLGILDTTGRPLQLKKIPDAFYRCGIFKNNALYIAYDGGFANGYPQEVLKLDTAMSVLLHTKPVGGNFGTPEAIDADAGGNIYMWGNNFSYSPGQSEPYIMKLDSLGVSGTCNSTAGAVNFVNVSVPLTQPAATPFNSSFAVISKTLALTDDPLGPRLSELVCGSLPNCTSVQVNGPDTICQLNQTIRYRAQRNPGCTQTVQWIYDTTYLERQAVTDSTIDFRFRIPGNTWLKVKINTGCNVYTDSLLIHIQNVAQNFSLGPDALLCPGASLVLRAGPGFSSYLWQNGSADSVFTVTSQGTYHVQVTNLCGNTYRDTVVVAAANLPALYIGNDTAVCVADTLVLHAGAGFVSYNWQPASLIHGQGAQVFLVPLSGATVTVSAVTQNGCVATDTLNIASKAARPVFLGNDTSFCASGQLTLNAGNAYQQYIWNTGANSPTITVAQPGAYSVTVTDVNGCRAKDTMNIVQVYALPQPALGNDFNICSNGSRTLDPGIFNSYLWQDGSTGRFLTVTATGAYWVRVTNNNQCTASDTIRLLQVFAAPRNFLKPVDSICQYESLKIIPLNNYPAYIWSTGANTQTITVQQPGVYYLRVTDSNNCTGSDTILLVQKNCFSGVLIPNAFTPNGDGLNDLFGPKVYGTAVSFRFEIYNRFGQMVFATTNPYSGWNGAYLGTAQPGGAFTWQCFYRLAGGAPEYRKGTVLLIR